MPSFSFSLVVSKQIVLLKAAGIGQVTVARSHAKLRLFISATRDRVKIDAVTVDKDPTRNLMTLITLFTAAGAENCSF